MSRSSPTTIPALPLAPLIGLAAAIFLSQTMEFMPGGLIPLISEDLGVELAIVAQLVSVFALTVVLTTAPLAVLTRRLPRKALLLTAFAIVCLANLAVGLGPTFGWIVAARIAGAVAHGLFWAVMAAYISEIAAPERLGQAIAITAAGGSLSGILGIPVGNALGQALGWRAAFVAVSVVGLVGLLALVRWLPSVRHSRTPLPGKENDSPRPHWRHATAVMAMICVLILVSVIGQTSFGPFMTAWLEEVAGFERSEIPLFLLVTGGAGAIGVLLTGRLYDRWPRGTFIAAGLTLAAAMSLYPASAASNSMLPMFVAAIMTSLAFAGIPAMLQTRMMTEVPPHLRAVAGAVLTTAINVGIGGGAVVGGLLVAGAGLDVLPVFAAGAALAGVISWVTWDRVRWARSRWKPPRRTPAESAAERIRRNGTAPRYEGGLKNVVRRDRAPVDALEE